MGDDGTAGPPAKKRGATRQISKDDGSDSEGESFVPLESGSFQKASEEVIASRRFVKVRRPVAAQGPPAPNPFASICLVAPTISSGAPLVPPAIDTAPSPSGEIVEGATVVKDRATKFGSTEAVCLDERQDEKGEVESAAESVEAAQASTHGSTVLVEEQGGKKVEGELAISESSKADDDAKKNTHSDDVDIKSDFVTKSNSNELASASTKNKGQEVDRIDGGLPDEGKGKEDVKRQSDDRGEQDTNEIGASEQGDAGKGKESAALTTTKGLDVRGVGDDLPPLGAATSGAFTFGTVPAAFETNTAFASFSSTWTAFGSGTGSGTGLGTGFTFGKAANDGTFASSSTPFGNSNGSSFQLFNTQSSSSTLSSAPPLQPPASAVQFQGGITPTGEEQEKMVFGADATLFEFMDGAWKERGKGEVRVNVPLDKPGKPRLLMRSKGNLRLILNASLFPDMKMTSMDSKGVTFACVNSGVEEKSGLATYALKFKDSSAADSFRDAVDVHKSSFQEDLKTPENSPSSLHGP